MENPDLCKNCKKPCCTRPSLTTDEYLRLYMCVGNDAIQKCGPVWVEDRMWMFKVGCPGLTSTGCALSHDERPLMCRLYPWIAVPCYGPEQEDAAVRLLLEPTCPNWKAFGDNYDTAKKEFENG